MKSSYDSNTFRRDIVPNVFLIKAGRGARRAVSDCPSRMSSRNGFVLLTRSTALPARCRGLRRDLEETRECLLLLSNNLRQTIGEFSGKVPSNFQGPLLAGYGYIFVLEETLIVRLP